MNRILEIEKDGKDFDYPLENGTNESPFSLNNDISSCSEKLNNGDESEAEVPSVKELSASDVGCCQECEEKGKVAWLEFIFESIE
jgi:hypothetical protein